MGFIKNLFARSNQDALQEAAPDSEFASYGAGTAAAAAPATASSASASAAAPADVPATPSDSDAGEAGAPLRLRDALRRRGSGGASDNAPGIKLPLIGHLPAQRQLSILSTVLAACILLSVGAVGLNIRNSSVTSAQTQIAADALMHSQRVGKAAPNAVQGNPEAFRQLEDSRKELNQDFKLMQAGGVYQGRNIGSPNAAMASAVAAARKIWDTTERSADTILRLKPELTGLEKTLRQLDRLSPDLLEQTEAIAALKLLRGATPREMAALGKLTMLTQRMNRSVSEFITAGGISAETAFQLGRDITVFRNTVDLSLIHI